MEIYSANIFIMLSKKSSDIVILNKINKAIVTLTDNSELREISRHWEISQKEE
ncbi:hypothetical protein C427_4845 [Paraglaciecola psychrophila 170]|uniref:Solute-binding protein family 3/N-terminal domain-containing protein n=1 Tax=Paraglaciecola psychrophila 170 TaxID=1129794 RepID=K6ZVR0_9ALTE|nr:hypothetical protein C427_4845 [Paraglaciecola psychrophila 170]GAC39976.1 hypothetical protein GPSY_4373 [Paraglaciecola psychrophila 170]